MIAFSPLTPARFELDPQATLYSTLYGDVYASADGAFAQATHVFLSGNDLPGRWRGARNFVIVETGFGAGVNFLAAWGTWRSSAAAGARLHYISVEKHPFLRDDLARVSLRWPHCKALAEQLLANYPLPLAGFHRLHLDAGRVVLTLLFGDVVDVLPELEARADAFFLDGFAPAKNPQMWSERVFSQLARLAAPGATAATYTVAAAVREGLQRAGFSVRKAPGFGNKQEMLCAHFEPRSMAARECCPPASAIVIGAGLAGSACATQLTARGVDVEVIERNVRPATEASGNPAGLLMPAFSLDWNLPTRLTVCAFLYARGRLLPLLGRGWFQTGVLQLARDEAHFIRHQRIIERYRLPRELVQIVDADEASILAGQRVAGPGWWLPSAGWADPAQVCRADLASARCILGRHVARLRRKRDETWEALDESGAVLGRAPLVILANAHGAAGLLGEAAPPLNVTRGQVSLMPQPVGTGLRAPVCREGYVTPAVNGVHCIGASYAVGCDDLRTYLEDHVGNLRRLERLLPGYATGVDARGLSGRVALRAVASDRIPLLGPCRRDADGLFACVGLASRGLAYAPLLAETLACMISGEPLPVERTLAARLSPTRFAPAL